MIENKREFKLISKKNPRSLLPNALTIFGVCLGLSSIKFALDLNYSMAVIAIGFAAILDTLDGRVARLIKGTSKVGKELDSLTDVISFGVAPSFVMYFWAINELGKFGWLAAFVYTVCACLRLARFNTQATSVDKRFFQGLPSPGAAAVIGGLVWSGTNHSFYNVPTILFMCFLITVVMGLLMVSNIRYHSFKEFDLKNRIPFVTFLIIVPVFFLIAVETALVLFLLAMIYAVSGPVMTLILLRKHRVDRKDER